MKGQKTSNSFARTNNQKKHGAFEPAIGEAETKHSETNLKLHRTRARTQIQTQTQTQTPPPPPPPPGKNSDYMECHHKMLQSSWKHSNGHFDWLNVEFIQFQRKCVRNWINKTKKQRN